MEQRPILWRADASQVAHAHELARGTTRTLCGEPIVDVRLSWPPKSKCLTCLAKAASRKAA